MADIKDFNFTSEVRESRLMRIHFYEEWYSEDEVPLRPDAAEFIEDYPSPPGFWDIAVERHVEPWEIKEFIGFRLGEQARSVRPLREDSALYANFAEILPSLHTSEFGKMVVSFANRFGPLFDIESARKQFPEPGTLTGGSIVHIKQHGEGKLHAYNQKAYITLSEPPFVEIIGEIGGEEYYIEDLNAWIHRITDFFNLREIWQNIQSEDIEYFQHIVRLDMTTDPQDFGTEFRSAYSLCGSGDRLLLSTAKSVLLQHLEQKLIGSFSVSVEGAGFTLKPSSLISAMYLQFASAVTGFDEGAFIQRCKVCGTWFEVSARAGRPEKTYCTDACRMRNYRKKKSATKLKGSLPSI